MKRSGKGRFLRRRVPQRHDPSAVNCQEHPAAGRMPTTGELQALKRAVADSGHIRRGGVVRRFKPFVKTRLPLSGVTAAAARSPLSVNTKDPLQEGSRSPWSGNGRRLDRLVAHRRRVATERLPIDGDVRTVGDRAYLPLHGRRLGRGRSIDPGWIPQCRRARRDASHQGPAASRSASKCIGEVAVCSEACRALEGVWRIRLCRESLGRLGVSLEWRRAGRWSSSSHPPRMEAASGR